MNSYIEVIVVLPDTYGGNSPSIPVYRYQNIDSNELRGYVIPGQRLVCMQYSDSDEWLKIENIIDANPSQSNIIGAYINRSFIFEIKADEEYDSSLDKLTEREMVYDIYSRFRFGKAVEDPDKYRIYSIENNYNYEENRDLIPPTAFVKKINAKLITSMPHTISKNISKLHTINIPIEGDLSTVKATVYGKVQVILAYLEKAMVDVSGIIDTEHTSVEYNNNYKEVYPIDITNDDDQRNLPDIINTNQDTVTATKFILSWDAPNFAGRDNLKIYYIDIDDGNLLNG